MSHAETKQNDLSGTTTRDNPKHPVREPHKKSPADRSKEKCSSASVVSFSFGPYGKTCTSENTSIASQFFAVDGRAYGSSSSNDADDIEKSSMIAILSRLGHEIEICVQKAEKQEVDLDTKLQIDNDDQIEIMRHREITTKYTEAKVGGSDGNSFYRHMVQEYFAHIMTLTALTGQDRKQIFHVVFIPEDVLEQMNDPNVVREKMYEWAVTFLDCLIQGNLESLKRLLSDIEYDTFCIYMLRQASARTIVRHQDTRGLFPSQPGMTINELIQASFGNITLQQYLSDNVLKMGTAPDRIAQVATCFVLRCRLDLISIEEGGQGQLKPITYLYDGAQEIEKCFENEENQNFMTATVPAFYIEMYHDARATGSKAKRGSPFHRIYRDTGVETQMQSWARKECEKPRQKHDQDGVTHEPPAEKRKKEDSSDFYKLSNMEMPERTDRLGQQEMYRDMYPSENEAIERMNNMTENAEITSAEPGSELPLKPALTEENASTSGDSSVPCSLTEESDAVLANACAETTAPLPPNQKLCHSANGAITSDTQTPSAAAENTVTPQATQPSLRTGNVASSNDSTGEQHTSSGILREYNAGSLRHDTVATEEYQHMEGVLNSGGSSSFSYVRGETQSSGGAITHSNFRSNITTRSSAAVAEGISGITPRTYPSLSAENDYRFRPSSQIHQQLSSRVSRATDSVMGSLSHTSIVAPSRITPTQRTTSFEMSRLRRESHHFQDAAEPVLAPEPDHSQPASLRYGRSMQLGRDQRTVVWLIESVIWAVIVYGVLLLAHRTYIEFDVVDGEKHNADLYAPFVNRDGAINQFVEDDNADDDFEDSDFFELQTDNIGVVWGPNRKHSDDNQSEQGETESNLTNQDAETEDIVDKSNDEPEKPEYDDDGDDDDDDDDASETFESDEFDNIETYTFTNASHALVTLGFGFGCAVGSGGFCWQKNWLSSSRHEQENALAVTSSGDWTFVDGELPPEITKAQRKAERYLKSVEVQPAVIRWPVQQLRLPSCLSLSYCQMKYRGTVVQRERFGGDRNCRVFEYGILLVLQAGEVFIKRFSPASRANAENVLKAELQDLSASLEKESRPRAGYSVAKQPLTIAVSLNSDGSARIESLLFRLLFTQISSLSVGDVDAKTESTDTDSNLKNTGESSDTNNDGAPDTLGPTADKKTPPIQKKKAKKSKVVKTNKTDTISAPGPDAQSEKAPETSMQTQDMLKPALKSAPKVAPKSTPKPKKLGQSASKQKTPITKEKRGIIKPPSVNTRENVASVAHDRGNPAAEDSPGEEIDERTYGDDDATERIPSPELYNNQTDSEGHQRGGLATEAKETRYAREEREFLDKLEKDRAEYAHRATDSIIQ